jgi:mannosyltransferase OCH1-like enzyme
MMIIKAGLHRYPVMYAEDGVYANIDIRCLRPIDGFISERFDEKDGK